MTAQASGTQTRRRRFVGGRFTGDMEEAGLGRGRERTVMRSQQRPKPACRQLASCDSPAELCCTRRDGGPSQLSIYTLWLQAAKDEGVTLSENDSVDSCQPATLLAAGGIHPSVPRTMESGQHTTRVGST